MTDFYEGFLSLSNEMPRCDAIHRGAELFGAPRFSVFDLMNNRETTLSRILGDFFDTKGTHGQEGLFVSNLLKLIGLHQCPKWSRVRLEAPIPVENRVTKRRLDILIETDKYLIGIENKKWTHESDNQLSDYLSYIKKAGVGKDAVRLIYISNNPPSVSDADIVQIPYFMKDIEDKSVDLLLSSSICDVKSAKIQGFIQDFRGWIGRTFGGAAFTDGLETYMDAIIEGLSDRKKAQVIGASIISQDKIHRYLIDQIELRIRNALSNIYADMSFGLASTNAKNGSLFAALSTKNEWWTARRAIWPERCFLAIEASQGMFRELYYGVTALDPDGDAASEPDNAAWKSADIDRLNSVTRAVPHGEAPDDWWRWHRAAPQADWTLKTIAASLVEGAGTIEESFGIDRMIDDLSSLAQAISGRS